MKADVEIMSKNDIWRPIYEVIDASFFEEKGVSTRILDFCKNNQNEPQFLTYEVKVILNNGFGIRVIFKSGHDKGLL